MTTSPISQLATTTRIIAADIKIAHSVFALPFALLAAVMAMRPLDSIAETTQFPPSWQRAFESAGTRGIWIWVIGHLLLIIAAMVLARTVAMLSNRLLDWRIDARNPRTAQRALPSGQLHVGQAMLALLGCAVGFMLVCLLFGWFFANWWPAMLALPVLLWISAYPLLKRITWVCHLYLGASLALSPLAAAIAIDPATILPGAPTVQPALWLLSGMVICWVGGFDIIYALQDVDIDRNERLHSIPARFGTRNALWISRMLHAIAVICLLLCWWIDTRLAMLFLSGVGVVALLLLYEQATVARWGTTRIALAFFTLNGVISCLLGLVAIADVLLT